MRAFGGVLLLLAVWRCHAQGEQTPPPDDDACHEETSEPPCSHCTPARGKGLHESPGAQPGARPPRQGATGRSRAQQGAAGRRRAQEGAASAGSKEIISDGGRAIPSGAVPPHVVRKWG